MVRAVFLHLPKTAGTSFREALCRGFGVENVSPPFTASFLSDQDFERLARYDVVAGHISITDARQLFPEAVLLTVLRDPIERCLSWYYYARALERGGPGDVIAAQTHDVDEFFTLDEEVVFANIFNRQVRQLGDHVLNREVDLDSATAKAKATLDECVWVGRQEQLDIDMAGLGAIFPEMAGVQAGIFNVTHGRPKARDVDEHLLSRVTRYNHYDLMLSSYCHSASGVSNPNC